MSQPIKIYCDGGCGGNPQVATFGYLIYFPKGMDKNDVGQHGVASDGDDATNNLAEYAAILHAIDKLKSKFESKHIDSPVKIFSDSRMVVKMINKEWGWKKMRWQPHRDHPHLEKMLRRILDALHVIDDWSVEWIPREDNKYADELAAVARERYEYGELGVEPLPELEQELLL